ncbi:MAG: low molecular weight phosphatase family protein [Alphaproteobacteria bacterium]|nr:low molecular weight phosphatase family protein [Alphaproteobacteria bacterium]MBV9419201.1 low molecular weight phosphatase family protein [Alphaproteobacteria bacterium]MBV9541375.1 low molecular weight phosphatase family protein [Alphaproteobacteria bacterium]MBV9904039.1 low molecular weight phosphatase family protein [Alphaproteobacteria bacterium]
MRGPNGEELPGAVLFACTMNSVRSVMAFAIMKHLYGKFVYVDAAGVRAGEPDPMAVEVMEEIGIEIGKYKPKRFEDMEDSSMFDLCITLSPEAQHRAIDLAHTSAIEIEYWPTLDPTMVEGSRDQRLDAYRATRDGIMRRIKDRFAEKSASDV